MVEDQNFFYSYDLRGNLIQKSAKIGPEVTTLRWDYFDRLVQVETSSKRVSYKYDATGRRIERLMEDLVNSTTKLNKWTYLNDEQWSEMNDLNQVLAVTLNGESIDDILSLSITPGIALDPVKDHLGSIHAWVNASTGTVEQKQKYSAYGETTVTQSSPVLASLGMLRGFTGRELDLDTKFQHNRARWYEPELGQFLSPDPIGFESGDENFYRYVNNKPISRSDPSGLEQYAGNSEGNSGYTEIGMTIGAGPIGTIGFQSGSGVTCIYIGGGVGSTGAYINGFDNGAPSPGGSYCAAGGFGIGGSASTSNGNDFSYGFGYTTPGASLTYTNNFICF